MGVFESLRESIKKFFKNLFIGLLGTISDDGCHGKSKLVGRRHFDLRYFSLGLLPAIAGRLMFA